MRLITFQDRYVLSKIQYEKENNRSPIYTSNELRCQSREIDTYKKFIEVFRERIKFPKDKLLIPIWCWVIVKKTKINKEVIFRHYERFRPKAENIVLLDLEVPNDGVFITSFSAWLNILFNIKFNKKVTDEMFNELFEKKPGSIIQACIPFIHESFIKEVRYLNSYKERDYSRTEKEIQELIESGECILDKNGNIWSIGDPMGLNEKIEREDDYEEE